MVVAPNQPHSQAYQLAVCSNAFNNDINGGKNMNGVVTGGIFVQGDYIVNGPPSPPPNTEDAHSKRISETPPSSPKPPPPTTASRHKMMEIAQHALKAIYLERFQKVSPFSLPFTFDIENTWVSLALKEEKKNAQATEDHGELLEQAFKKVKMLVIEGDPATGKTSLMRRLAYEWAKQKEERHRKSKFTQLKNWVWGKPYGQEERKQTQLLCYDLVLYAEFRELRDETFESIAELVLHYSKTHLTEENYRNLKELMNNEKFCKELRILVLLDGYDESSLEKQCSELSSYITEKMLGKTMSFDTVITTRKGYLSTYRDAKGGFVFAEVLGFTTMTQKDNYISKHFLSQENDNEENIAAVLHLLKNNENWNKLAETPLFLTFICLVYEKIIDGTLLELYCNIIRWLIDRRQQDNPECNIPSDFGFQNVSAQVVEPLNIREKQNTIQKHYLQFPQLLCLGKMALNNLKKDVFQETDFSEFNIKPIIHQVGLIRKDEFYDQSWNLTTTFCFPHRTIQEFLAAFYCFCSDDPTNEIVLPNSKLDTSEGRMKEFERFLLRIALSDKMPIQTEKRKYYFERIADLKLDITFDAFNTTAGCNRTLLNWFLSQCANVQSIELKGKLRNAIPTINMANDTSMDTEWTVRDATTEMVRPTVLSFSDLTKLHTLIIGDYDAGYIFEINSQLSIANCTSLKNLQLKRCEFKSSTNFVLEKLPSLGSVKFDKCTFEAYSQLSFIVPQNDLTSFGDLTKLCSLRFLKCSFAANSRLSFTNCSALKNLEFSNCEMKGNIDLGFATLSPIDTVEFDHCNNDSAAWRSITEQLRNTTVKCFQLKFGKGDFNKGVLMHLREWKNIEEMEIELVEYKIPPNDLLPFSDLEKLLSVTFQRCPFEANSPLSFTNCPSLKNLEFSNCEMIGNIDLGFATYPPIDTVEFDQCKIDLAAWQSITDQIRNSSVKFLQLSAKYFMKESNPEFLPHLQKCECIENIVVRDTFSAEIFGYVLKRYEEEITANLAQTAQNLLKLKSIAICDKFGSIPRLQEYSKEQIEQAGQARDPDFSIKYVGHDNSRLEE